MPSWDDWLRRLRHDLVKRLLWPARDRRDLGGQVGSGELAVTLIDDEGRPATAEAVWVRLRQEAPSPAHSAVAAFEPVLWSALSASRRDDLAGVLALEAAFDELSRRLAQEG